jgi:electron transfer flavoprotein alpha subunit
MRILVLGEHQHQRLRPASVAALGFASTLANQTGGAVECLILGDGIAEVAGQAASYARVLSADHPALAHPLADRYAALIAQLVRSRRVQLLTAASTTFAKDIVSRAAGLLGGAMASDVVAHDWRDGQLYLRRPMYAGAVLATVTLSGEPRTVTVRASAYAPCAPARDPFEIETVAIDAASLPSQIEFEKLESRGSHRPDVTEARIVVSGGRGIKNAADFERLVGGLADCLGGATGSSRALVDAGIAPNDLQVGQTGKVVAPDVYFAIAISGAVQHLAGMKNSKIIVAINKDADAPIFQSADYGLVGDVYELVPQLIRRLCSR